MAEIYRHIRLDTNEVFYIGIGKSSDRAFSYKKRNKHWTNIVNKTEYEVQVLKSDLSWDDACELEKILISYYGRKDLGLGTLVNMTDGGDGCIGFVITDEYRQKISNSNKGKKRSQDTKDKISISKIGNKNVLGMKHSDETKSKIGLKSIGRKKSKDAMERMSIMMSNGGNPMAKLVLNLETGIYYDTILEASITAGISFSLMRYYLNDNNKDKNKTSFIKV
jgi:hypothetical protein